MLREATLQRAMRRPRSYVAVLDARFRVMLQYRAAAFAGLVTQIFWGWVRVTVFTAFYHSTTTPQPMALPDTVTYLWLIQAMLLLLPWRLDGEITQMIRTGAVAYELARPVDLYWLWFSRNLAGRVAMVLLRCIPMVLLAGLFLGLKPPATVASGAAALLAIAGAFVLSATLTTLMCCCLFWTISGDGINRMISMAAGALSGSIIPLAFFPDWAQPVLNVLPFRGLMDLPFRLYVGHIPAGGVWAACGHQWAWIGALILLGRWILRRSVRRVVVQGG